MLIIFLSYLLQKAQQTHLWKSAFSNSSLEMTSKLTKTLLLLLCCSLTAQQSWSCTDKLLAGVTSTKIYTVPLTLNNTPRLTLCLNFPLDKYAMPKVGHAYGLSIKGYTEEGVWETDLTRKDGLTKEDVLDKLTDENFWSVEAIFGIKYKIFSFQFPHIYVIPTSLQSIG